CRTCKVNASKIRMFENHFSSNWTIHIDQVDYSIRHTCFFENFHQDIRRINLSIGRLPNDGITHHSCRCRKVSSDCRKVEWSQSEHETFQRTLFNSVPYSSTRNWRLLRINLSHVLHIETQEVNDFTS